MVLTLCLTASAIKTQARTQQRLQSTTISGVNTLLEYNPKNTILSFIATRAATSPTAETISTLLSEMAEQYQDELTQITSSMVSTDDLCEVALTSYDLSVKTREEYIGVVSESLEDIDDEVSYYSETITGLSSINDALTVTVTNVNSLLTGTESQCSIMQEILQTTDEQLEEIVETIVTLEPTSLSSVNSPGQYVQNYQINNLLQEKSNKIGQIESEMQNLVQFSQEDLSMAYNYVKQLQVSVESAMDSYSSRIEYSEVQSGSILASISELEEQLTENLENLNQEESHLSSMSQSYETIEAMVSNSIARYQALETAEETSCNLYLEQSETLATSIKEGLSMIEELQLAVMEDYENLSYYLNKLSA